MTMFASLSCFNPFFLSEVQLNGGEILKEHLEFCCLEKTPQSYLNILQMLCKIILYGLQTSL